MRHIKTKEEFLKESVSYDTNIIGKKLYEAVQYLQNDCDYHGEHNRIVTAADSFNSITDAIEFAKSRGYSVGNPQNGNPYGIKEGNYDISKWNNLGQSGMQQLDGIILESRTKGVPDYILYFEFPTEQ